MPNGLKVNNWCYEVLPRAVRWTCDESAQLSDVVREKVNRSLRGVMTLFQWIRKRFLILGQVSLQTQIQAQVSEI